jgi:DNA-binding SARP family transcriptional activator
VSRPVRVARGLAALTVLVVLVVGVPWALATFIGWPLPHALPAWSQLHAGLTADAIPNRVLLDVLACVCWLAWAVLSASVVTEAAAAMRGRSAPRLWLAGPAQPLAAHLVAAIALALLVLPRPAEPARPALAATLPAATAAVMFSAGSTGSPTAPGAMSVGIPASDAVPDASTVTRPYLVQRGDTLWGIATRELGDPYRWPEIFEINRDRPQPDGRALTDPNRIWPGWTLLIPAAVAPPSPPPLTAPTPAPVRQPPGTIGAVPTLPPRVAAHAAPAPRASGPEESHRPAATTIQLDSGSLLAASFAAGVLATLGLGRLRRRRSYRPAAPQPGRCLDPAPLGPTLRRLATQIRHDDPLHLAPDGVQDGVDGDARPERSATPALLEIGIRGDAPVHLDLTRWSRLTLTGPATESVARAWVAALVLAARPGDVEILTTEPLAHRLVPGLSNAAAVRCTPTNDILLAELTAVVIGRTRRLTDAELPDAATYRQRHPEDPFPLIVTLLGDVSDEAVGRWQAATPDASRLHIVTISLGEPGFGASCIQVGADGTVAGATPAELAEQLAAARLFTMTQADAAELLEPIARHHLQAAAEEQADEQTAGPGPAPPRHGGMREPADQWPDLPDLAATSPRPIEVSVLGRSRISAHGQEITSRLRGSAKELLTWYLLRPDGAPAEAAIDALWPDVPPERGPERFWNALGNLRSRLRDPHGGSEIEVLAKAGDHYRPQAELLAVDLWEFQQALGQAAHAQSDDVTREALERAVSLYRGPFVDGADYLWVEPIREDLHRRALDAHMRLAELRAESNQHEAAIEVLEHAIEVDPICEEAYRRLIALQARLDRTDAAQRAWRLLQGRLAELELDPEPNTEALVQQCGVHPRRTAGLRLSVRSSPVVPVRRASP